MNMVTGGAGGWLDGLVLRIVLPLGLLPCILFRPTLFSYSYLLLYLVIPFLKLPEKQPIPGRSPFLLGYYMRCCLVLGFGTVTAQIIWQIVLLSLAPYGKWIGTCTFADILLRHVGMVRLDGLDWVQLLRWLGPDAVALATILLTYIALTRNPSDSSATGSAIVDLQPQQQNESSGLVKLLSTLSPYVVLLGLCVTSSLQPSLPSSVYYVVFLIGASWWSLCGQLKNRFFATLFALLAGLVSVHVSAIFTFQTEVGRNWVTGGGAGQDGLLVRLLGLVVLLVEPSGSTDIPCNGNSTVEDVRVLILNRSLELPSFLCPLALLALFHLLVYTTRDILHSITNEANHPERKEDSSARKLMSQKRRSYDQDVTTENDVLSSGDSGRRRSSSRDGNPTSMAVLSGGSGRTNSFKLSYAKTSKKRKRRSGGGDDVSCPGGGDGGDSKVHSRNFENGEDGGGGLLLAGLLTLFDLFAKSSYVATNIIMMAWSITYHSWLTFLLLLGACILWMFPNQRRAMLSFSPGLVLYAELLLIAQYVFSLALTDAELPQAVHGIQLDEIGLIKCTGWVASTTIIVKSLYTCMFWITLRQYVMERRDRRNNALAVDEEAQPFHIVITDGIESPPPAGTSTNLGASVPVGSSGSMLKLGSYLKQLMTKFWIWVVAIMLFVIGLGGEKVVLYRIVYMALGLLFLLTFQLSYVYWRRLMYGFWLTVILYSMLVLVSIYIYQFANIPALLSNYTHIPKQLQSDIGLERYDTGSLFIRLLTPTFFVIITVIQLHYFHKDFLTLSAITTTRASVGISGAVRGRSKKTERVEPVPPTVHLIDEMSWPNFKAHTDYYATVSFHWLRRAYKLLSTSAWKLAQLHLMKVVLLCFYLLTTKQPSALHLILYTATVLCLCLQSAQRLLVHFCSIYISALLLAKMIYQIDYIEHADWDRNCTFEKPDEMYVNVTKNDAEWLGLVKTNSLTYELQGYIGLILLLTIQAVVYIRYTYLQPSRNNPNVPNVLFPSITRKEADTNLPSAIKYLLNFCFYKFGLEITLVTLVIVIGTRLDFFSVLYSLWLIPLFRLERQKVSRIWVGFIGFVAVLLPLQYIAAVGLPPVLCPEYPWEGIPVFRSDEELIEWLFLPNFISPPNTARLLPDFFLLLFASLQYLVFRTEKEYGSNYAGGSNTDIYTNKYPGGYQGSTSLLGALIANTTSAPDLNPVPDFLTTSKTWLDVLKKSMFLSFYWITLGTMFLTGTTRVNLFALGYLIGSFTFLWEGNEFYLRSRRTIVKRWNYLLGYNVFVILSKTVLQLVGCVFYTSLPCWIIQLLGVACLKFGDNSGIPGYPPSGDKSSGSTCKEPQNEAGLMWDTITFTLLLFQRKIFTSHYFIHIRSETEAQASLASRGAELIGELMQKQISEQAEEEREVLEKIKTKMDRIKAVHQRGGKPKENHFDASSMVSSGLSDDEVLEDLKEEPLAPMAPLAVQVSTGLSSLGPTPTPSSAANTISVEGFFEPPYGHQRLLARDQSIVMRPPRLPLSPSDESFPVFSPPPGGHGPNKRSLKGRQVGVQTSPPYNKYPTCSSPAPSHHTSIRSGDYYMFADYEDEDMQMIDSIVEEGGEGFDMDNEDDELLPGPTGLTVSQLMASALKSGDVETAAELASRKLNQVRRQSSEVSSIGGVGLQDPLQRRLSMSKKRRQSQKRTCSFTKSDKQRSLGRRVPSEGEQAPAPAPLALSDGEGGGLDVAGGDGGGPSDDPSDEEEGSGVPVDPSAPSDQIAPPPPTSPNYLRRLFGYLRFAWAFLESLMTSGSNYLNKFSRDYRLVAKCLAEEKQRLKESQMIGLGPLQLAQQPGRNLAQEQGRQDDLFPGQGQGPGDGFGVPDTEEKRSTRSMDSVSSSTSLIEDIGREDTGTYYPPLVHFLVALWYVVISHSDLVCYFVIFLNQMKSASLLSLPLPLLVLLWGSLSVPRPSKTFWVTIIAYTEAIVVIKYLFQFEFFPWNDIADSAVASGSGSGGGGGGIVGSGAVTTNGAPGSGTVLVKDPFTPTRILGIEKHGKYAVYDVTLLMVVFFHRFMLKSLGLWKNKAGSSWGSNSSGGGLNPNPNEPDPSAPVYLIETDTGRAERVAPPQKTKEESQVTSNGENVGGAEGQESGSGSGSSVSSSSGVGGEMSGTGVAGCVPCPGVPCWPGNNAGSEDGSGPLNWEIVTTIQYGPTLLKLCFTSYLSSIRTFFLQILNLEYKVKVDVYSYMFMCDFINFLVIIFGFSAFGSSQQADVSSYLEENKVPVPFLVMVILQFALIVIDRALYLRKYILGKFFYQIFLVTFVHSAMFFALPAVTEKEFGASAVPQLWYMVKCIYLLFSAYQIRSGYPTRILGNFLCKKYNYVNMFLFKGFMAVPFLFELRALMDWIWTDTSMTLSDWLKLEDIFAHIFQLKCQRRVEKEYPQGRGMPKARWSKYAIGGSSLFIIIAIIWFPLVLFALGNTVGISNPPREISVQITIGSYQPIFTMSAQNHTLKKFSPRDWNNFLAAFRGEKEALYFLNNYESDDVVAAQFNGNSDAIWGISPPSRTSLIQDLKSSNPVSIRFAWSVARETPSGTGSGGGASSGGGGKYKQEVFLEPNNPSRLRLIEMISGNYTGPPVRIPHIFPKFLKIANTGKNLPADKMKKGGNESYIFRNLKLSLKRDPEGGSLEWWDIEEVCNPEYDNLPLDDHCKPAPLNSTSPPQEHLNMFTFNEKSFPPTLSFISGGGIIGLYTTLVLVASKFVRSFFAGISFLIMFDDMPNVDRVFQLCLDIYLVRESGELALEEDLFAKMIFLYRSPETLIKWTRPKRIPNSGREGNEDDTTEVPAAIPPVPTTSHHAH